MVSQFKMNKTNKLKNGEFYFVLIMKLRRCSLRKMMNEGLVNDEIRRQVLEGLKQIVTYEGSNFSYYTNGDLKERV